MRHLFFAAALVAASAAVTAAPVQLLHDAAIHTGAQPPTVDAMAWNAQGELLAVGTTAALRERFPDAETIDAQGRAVVPGLIDAHGHVMGLGIALMRADLVGAGSRLEVMERLRAFAADLPPDAWLLGRGWDQNDWADRRFPTAAELDAVFPDRPVWLERIDGHAAWANSAAMRAVGRDLDGDWQPDGGRIVRDDDGRATGIFVDAAMALVERAVPPPSPDALDEALERALADAVRLGLTGVHDMGVSLSDLARYRRFADAGRLPLRITAYADGDAAALEALCAMGPYAHDGGRLAMRGVKLYVDGALGSRGAALLADYSDEPGNRGLLLTEPDALRAAIDKAYRCGVQVAAHGIGDRGNRLLLDAFTRYLPNAGVGERRWRIEHAQVIAPEDIPRFAAMGVIASMQPTHATSDMPWAADRLGDARLAGAYAWRSLLDAGARLALGSDFPVEPVNPMIGLYAALTRQDADGEPEGGWRPHERLRAREALRGFTLDAAYAGFAEDAVGTLEPGKRADFVILDADPLAVDAAALRSIEVIATYVDGRAVYRRGD